MATASKPGGKRKVWFTKTVTHLFPSGLILGLQGDNKPDGAKSVKVSSPWKAGKFRLGKKRKRIGGK